MNKRILSLLSSLLIAFCCSFVGCGKYGGQDAISLEGFDKYDHDSYVSYAKENGFTFKSFKQQSAVPYYKLKFRGLDEDEMMIGGYIGPRTQYPAEGYLLPSTITDEVFGKIEESGVNYIIENAFDYSSDKEQVTKALNLANEHNINYFICVNDAISFSDSKGYKVVDKDQLKQYTLEMMQFENFGGFYGRDEPTTKMFSLMKTAIDTFKEVKSEIGQTANDLYIYYNLFPNVSVSQLNGESVTEEGDSSTNAYRVSNYREYLENYLSLKHNFISVDSYPLTKMQGSVSAGWFDSLGVLNRYAINNQIPWMGYAQAGGSYPTFITNRVVDEYELCWDINTMLAFGCKGVSYYPLITPPEMVKGTPEENVNEDCLLNKYGNKTKIYGYAKKINKQIKAIDHILLNSAHQGVILHGDSPCVYRDNKRENESDLLTSYRGLKSVSGDSALIGCFDYNGRMALLVVNNSFTNHKGQIILNFDENYCYVVTQRATRAMLTGKDFTLQLEAGECALIEVL